MNFLRQLNYTEERVHRPHPKPMKLFARLTISTPNNLPQILLQQQILYLILRASMYNKNYKMGIEESLPSPDPFLWFELSWEDKLNRGACSLTPPPHGIVPNLYSLCIVPLEILSIISTHSAVTYQDMKDDIVPHLFTHSAVSSRLEMKDGLYNHSSVYHLEMKHGIVSHLYSLSNVPPRDDAWYYFSSRLTLYCPSSR